MRTQSYDIKIKKKGLKKGPNNADFYSISYAKDSLMHPFIISTFHGTLHIIELRILRNTLFCLRLTLYSYQILVEVKLDYKFHSRVIVTNASLDSYCSSKQVYWCNIMHLYKFNIALSNEHKFE